MSQAELGTRAGYGGGAAVSINRFENGLMLPGEERLRKIATALGLPLESLISSDATAPDVTPNLPNVPARVTTETLKDRAARVQREINDQTNEVGQLITQFADASATVAVTFSGPRDELASRIRKLPEEPIFPPERRQHPAWTAESAVELLAPADSALSSVPSVLRSDVWHRTIAESVSRAFLAAAFSSRTGRGADHVTNLVAATAAGIVVGGLGSLSARNKAQQREIAARLDHAEAKISRFRPGIEALRSIIPRAVELLEYVAVHGAHALSRYQSTLAHRESAEGINWGELSESEQQSFKMFAEIEVAKNAVAGIDLEGLLSAPDEESLRTNLSQINELISRCREVVESRV